MAKVRTNTSSKKPQPKVALQPKVTAKDEERVYRSFYAILSSFWWRLEPIYRAKFRQAAGPVMKRMNDPIRVQITHDMADPLVKRFVVDIIGMFDKAARQARISLGQRDAASWDIRNVSIYDQIKQHEIKLAESTISDIQAATADEAQRLIEQMQVELLAGQKAGETLADKTDRLAKFFAESARWKARRIAVTESNRAHNAGFLAGTEDMEVVVGYEWLLSDDACEECKRIGLVNGRPRRVKKGQPFATGQSKEAYYATIQTPPLHPNCRCTLVGVLDVEAPDKWDETVAGSQPDKPVQPAPVEVKPEPPKPPVVTPQKPLSVPQNPAPSLPSDSQGVGPNPRFYDPSLIVKKQDKLDFAQMDIENVQLMHGATDQEMRQFVDGVKQTIRDAELVLRIKNMTFEQFILDGDGRFKSQFETGTSGGTFNPVYRKQAESEILGYPKTMKDKDRPIYGYLSHKDELERPTGKADQYGDVIIRLKPEVKKRATVTGGNSLNRSRSVYAQPISKPLDDVIMGGNLMTSVMNKKDITNGLTPEQLFKSAREYAEFQVAGGLSLKDVAEVSISKFSIRDPLRRAELVDKIKNKGIKVIERDSW